MQAALDLFGERGFERTTVVEIAERAGLTERTFFRYFADKREVLFAGASMLQDAVVQAVVDAPHSATPLDAAVAGIEAASAVLQDDRGLSRRRQAVINANRELQERELIKLAALGTAIADALRRRGVKDPTASLTAEMAIAVFKISFGRWVTQSRQRELRSLIRASLIELKGVATS
jgi:AcrR family transcriptional regulator